MLSYKKCFLLINIMSVSVITIASETPEETVVISQEKFDFIKYAFDNKSTITQEELRTVMQKENYTPEKSEVEAIMLAVERDNAQSKYKEGEAKAKTIIEEQKKGLIESYKNKGFSDSFINDLIAARYN